MVNHDFDEETFREKIKRGAGVFTLIGSGILAAIHTLSHVVPAIGLLGLAIGENSGVFYNIVSSEYMQFAYVPLVVLSFWYIYRDHKHHKHEKELRQENERLKSLLKKK